MYMEPYTPEGYEGEYEVLIRSNSKRVVLRREASIDKFSRARMYSVEMGGDSPYYH